MFSENSKRLLKKLLPLIGIVIFIYIIWSMDVSAILSALHKIPLFILFISMILTIPRIIIRAFYWRMILHEQGIDLPLHTCLKIFLIGMFYGTITPSYFGQLMRVPYLKEHTGQPLGKLFISVILEVVIHNIGLYILIIVGALLLVSRLPQLAYITLVGISIMILVLAFFAKPSRGDKTFALLIKVFVPRKFRTIFERFTKTFYADFPKIKKLIIPFIFGIITWIIILSQEYLLVYSLDSRIDYLSFLVFFPIANFAGFLPITFAGLGTREAASIWIFNNLFGVPQETIFVFTLLGFVITDVTVGVIGFFAALIDARKKGVRLGDNTQVLKEFLD